MTLEVVWTVIALFGLVRSAMLYREALMDRRVLGKAGNGKRILADWQVEHAWIGIIIYLLLTIAGVVAMVSTLGYLSLAIRFFALPAIFVALILALVIRQERDAIYRRRNLKSNKPMQIAAIAQDTNVRVRHIEQKLDETDDRGGA